jgi:TonB family protein
VIVDDHNRAFQYAIVASLALHALLLFAFPEVFRPARSASFPPPLVARLIELQAEPSPPAVTEAPKPEKPKAPLPRREAPRPSPSAVPQPQALPAPVPAPAPVPRLPAPAEDAPRAEPQTAASQRAPGPAVVGSTQPPDSMWQETYRIDLIDQARRHKRYPPLARENNWQGSVAVAIAVAPSGRASVSLKSSSGYDVLDRQALDMFTQAARAVVVPPTLRGKAFAVEVRAVYGLEE